MSDLFVSKFISFTLNGILVYGLLLILDYGVRRVISTFSSIKIQKIEHSQNASQLYQIKKSMIYNLVSAAFLTSISYLIHSNFTSVYFEINQYSLGYYVFSIILVLVLFEVYFFFTHKILHSKYLFSKIHYVHHRVKTTSVSAILCLHPIEAFIYYSFHTFIIMFLPLHLSALAVVQFLIVFGNIYSHAGYEFFPRFIRVNYKFLITPTDHDRHHLDGNCNYGYFTTTFDQFFKSLRRN